MPTFHRAVKKTKHLKVAFAGWPLNGSAYHCAVDSASDVFGNTMIFSTQQPLPETFQMNFAKKWRWIVVDADLEIIRSRTASYKTGSILTVNFVTAMKIPWIENKRLHSGFYAPQRSSEELLMGFFFPFVWMKIKGFAQVKLQSTLCVGVKAKGGTKTENNLSTFFRFV